MNERVENRNNLVMCGPPSSFLNDIKLFIEEKTLTEIY